MKYLASQELLVLDKRAAREDVEKSISTSPSAIGKSLRLEQRAAHGRRARGTLRAESRALLRSMTSSWERRDHGGYAKKIKEFREQPLHLWRVQPTMVGEWEERSHDSRLAGFDRIRVLPAFVMATNDNSHRV